MAGSRSAGLEQCWELMWTQIEVSFLALAAALLITLPIALYLGHRGTGELVAVAIGNAGRAIPELALIAFMAAFIGLGTLNLTIALMVLGIPPILTNTFVGIRQVDRGAVEAARGMGMSELGVIRRVELPLAVPTIMSGVRTAAINIVATATIAPLAGVLTLGDFIINVNVYGDDGVLAGALLVALLALAVELGLAGAAAAADAAGLAARAGNGPPGCIGLKRPPRVLLRGWQSNEERAETMRDMTTRLRVLVDFGGCARRGGDAGGLRRRRQRPRPPPGAPPPATTRSSNNPDNNGIKLTVGSKNFTEQFILGEIYAQALEAAGYDVSTDLNLGSEQVALEGRCRTVRSAATPSTRRRR